MICLSLCYQSWSGVSLWNWTKLKHWKTFSPGCQIFVKDAKREDGQEIQTSVVDKIYQQRQFCELVRLENPYQKCIAFSSFLRPCAEVVLMELNSNGEKEPSVLSRDTILEEKVKNHVNNFNSMWWSTSTSIGRLQDQSYRTALKTIKIIMAFKATSKERFKKMHATSFLRFAPRNLLKFITMLPSFGIFYTLHFLHPAFSTLLIFNRPPF